MIRFFLRMWQRNKDRKKKTVPSESKAIILTDMNDDCLVHIFLYLSLGDLLNIADTNKQLKPAAELTFAKRFKRGKLILRKLKKSSEIHINETEQVKVKNPYQLLRCFGHLIPNQKIQNRTLLKYVNQYCSESIINIGLSSLGRYIKKPFPNAETVTLRCRLKWSFNRLPKLFPNVRVLSFFMCGIQPRYIAVHFPHLNEVNIGCSLNIYGAKCYVKMLRFNPQIRHLYLSPIIDDVRLLRTANQFIQFLEHLHLRYLEDSYMNFEEKFVHFAYLKVLKIVHIGEITTPIPVSSSCLKSFSFHLHTSDPDYIENLDILLEFLRMHPFITTFTLSSDCNRMCSTNKFVLQQILEAVSSMEEIDISLIKNLSAKDAIKFVNKCKSLKKLNFRADDNSIFDQLNAKLEVKWQVLIEKLNESKMFDVKIVRRCT